MWLSKTARAAAVPPGAEGFDLPNSVFNCASQVGRGLGCATKWTDRYNSFKQNCRLLLSEYYGIPEEAAKDALQPIPYVDPLPPPEGSAGTGVLPFVQCLAWEMRGMRRTACESALISCKR